MDAAQARKIHKTARELANHPAADFGDFVWVGPTVYHVYDGGLQGRDSRWLEMKTRKKSPAYVPPTRRVGVPAKTVAERATAADLNRLQRDRAAIKKGFDAVGGHKLAAAIASRPDVAECDSWEVNGHKYEIVSVQVVGPYSIIILEPGLKRDGKLFYKGKRLFGDEKMADNADALGLWREREALIGAVQETVLARWSQTPPSLSRGSLRWGSF